MTTGIVFDIKEFTVHDGPGIRTTVFLKGCPLACMWCHNPESQSMQPLFQAEFLAECIDLLEDGTHVLLDTCGHAPAADFQLVLARTDLVYYDLKLIDRAAHLQYTGVDNDLILSNLQLLAESGKPFVIRVPLVPGVTDTDENLAGIAKAVENMPGLVELDLLPYNRAAGAKYRSAGMEFKPDYDETNPVNFNMKIFEQAGLKVKRV